jgi:hypothetical protein
LKFNELKIGMLVQNTQTKQIYKIYENLNDCTFKLQDQMHLNLYNYLTESEMKNGTWKVLTKP